MHADLSRSIRVSAIHQIHREAEEIVNDSNNVAPNRYRIARAKIRLPLSVTLYAPSIILSMGFSNTSRLILSSFPIRSFAYFSHLCLMCYMPCLYLNCLQQISVGTRAGQLVQATSRKVAGSIPDGLVRSFHCHNPSGAGVDSASNRNYYQEYFLGSKGGRCLGLTTLPPSCAVCLKYGNLSFLEPSGAVQACNGIALPLQQM